MLIWGWVRSIPFRETFPSDVIISLSSLVLLQTWPLPCHCVPASRPRSLLFGLTVHAIHRPPVFLFFVLPRLGRAPPGAGLDAPTALQLSLRPAPTARPRHLPPGCRDVEIRILTAPDRGVSGAGEARASRAASKTLSPDLGSPSTRRGPGWTALSSEETRKSAGHIGRWGVLSASVLTHLPCSLPRHRGKGRWTPAAGSLGGERAEKEETRWVSAGGGIWNAGLGVSVAFLVS